MAEDFEFHRSKRTDRTFVSPRINDKIRIASKVMDTEADYHFAIERHELVLRELPGVRHEITAKFTEDDRRIFVLTFQKYRTEGGVPLERLHFSFRNEEIPKLIEFLNHVEKLYFPDAQKINVRDEDLRVIAISDERARRLISEKPELVAQIARNEITEQDIVALAYRRKQLARFEQLMIDPTFFESERAELQTYPEGVWQAFFEANQWVFGYGLSYVFTRSLDHKRLEQTVHGHSIAGSGKRVDGLLKTQALISALCFVEIKRHDTELLKTTPYRSDVWAPSNDLSGGVAQVQETVRSALDTFSEQFRPEDEDGNPTGEELFNIQPRSFLVIGSLGEFKVNGGTNKRKYRSFETFRRNVRQPEIITFDELLYRAKFIVETTADE